MTPLILMFVYFLVAVDGAAPPAPTLAARLARRQNVGVAVVWSPTVVGTIVSYAQFGYNGASTVATLGNYWGWCPVGESCQIATFCQSGTVFYPATSIVCLGAVCGSEYLYSTIGAELDFARPACFSPGVPNFKTFFVMSPTAGPISTTAAVTSSSPVTSTTSSTPSSPGPTSPPTPTPAPKPIGAIVGGVVGSLAVLALAAIAVLLLLRRRNKQPAPEPAPAQPAVVATDPKHALYAGGYTSAPSSPPPIYHNTASPVEVSTYRPPIPGSVEMNANQSQR